MFLHIPDIKIISYLRENTSDKLNLWLTTPRISTQVKETSATDWQMAARRDNLISITLHK